MCKEIYSLKVFTFRSVFVMTEEPSGICAVCEVVVSVYVKVWFCFPLAAEAPNHDLKLLQDLVVYKQKDSAIY